MKIKLFFFAMLVNVAASAQVTNVTPVSANYTDKTVSFRVWWNAGSRDATHLSKVWVWVDYIQLNANNTTAGNSWTRATVGTISGGATSYDGSYRNGFWLEGNASTNYSATLTVQLTNVPAKFNWCAYVSDYPPNVTADNGTYTFKGTPPFTLIASDGTTIQTITGTTLAASALTVTPTTIKDKTACPGVFCIYTGSDLYIDATHLCQQRTSSAKNWEAWIEDSRDGLIYRIVQYSNGVWWWADNYSGSYGYERTCNGTRLYSATNKSQTCPSGWQLPTRAEVNARFKVPPTSDDWDGPLKSMNTFWEDNQGRCYSTSAYDRCDVIVIDYTTAHWARCTYTNDINNVNKTPGAVRCIRQL